MYSSLATKNKP